VVTTGVNDRNTGGLPTSFAVDQNFPNPFNPSTTIRYALPMQAQVTLKVYNMLGQEVTTLVNTQQTGGYYTAVWDGTTRFGSHVSSGVYTYRLDATAIDGRTLSTQRKMVMLK
jgi:flagellar hook assembly protein FlgD